MSQDDRNDSRSQRKVVGGYFVTLDGVAEAADRFLTGWDDEVDARGAELIANQDTIILGRRTYDEWLGFWPRSDVEPFASFINSAPKYVATSTPLQGDWANSSVIDGDLAEFVKHLKTQPGGDIGIHGSISVTQTLLAAGLVDELQLVIVPTIAPAAGQKKLLDNLPPIQLETISSSTTPSGYLLVSYRVLR
ncbi:dihydrofolate reductase [Kribbella sp. VKM Ac-2571]|uniref:dihydrofolate reductase family protein n=1 Tax=Kribbella sp. VKM Ac-2571 TaxID=2512222 RepID=UPI0010620974|nr:dihydrofolate reductase family protein [Kribbella sp. VKM Ac-2571]TDO67332.1 dihydrofolate reductase [Kribbella sp. VKM Ac-2571]